MNEPVKKAALRYFGGKWKIAPWIIDHFPPHDFYVEPFGGGASVLLQKVPAKHGEVYNDKDKEIVNFFQVARDHSGGLQIALMLTPYAEDELIACDQLDGAVEGDMIELARRTCVKAFMSIGSDGIVRPQKGFRFGIRGKGNKPAAYDWMNYHKRIPALANRLRGVMTLNRDAIEVCKKFDGSGTLHYLDPPYVHSTRKDSYKSNYMHEMTDSDHRRFIQEVQELEGMVIISGYENKIYDVGLKGWGKEMVETYTSNIHEGSAKAKECIWMNGKVMKHNKQEDLENLII